MEDIVIQDEEGTWHMLPDTIYTIFDDIKYAYINFYLIQILGMEIIAQVAT